MATQQFSHEYSEGTLANTGSWVLEMAYDEQARPIRATYQVRHQQDVNWRRTYVLHGLPEPAPSFEQMKARVLDHFGEQPPL